jgi:L-lactate dehydrogenase complex protein LldG
VRLGVPADLPAAWLPGGVEAQAAERLDPRALDTLGAALTGCALAIAETGTIVLDTGPRQGPRTLSLVPDHHLCVVDEADRGRVPEAMSSIARTIVRPVAR